MKILETMAREGFEEILALHDPSCGLAGFMLLHDTSRGPAAGGIRLFPYATEEAALADGLKLARAMSFKAAAAKLRVGGGKIVLMERPDLRREEVGRAGSSRAWAAVFSPEETRASRWSKAPGCGVRHVTWWMKRKPGLAI
ncbi:MAG: Glu/Leu/Phe/Val dehydrogenase dimerization domain-containing protein [Acidobacteriota bacterium]